MTNTTKEREVRAWHLLLEDDNYRLDLPDDFYQTLINRADELVLREVIDLSEWQQLKDTADEVYAKTLQGLSVCQRDRVDTVAIDLHIDTTRKTASHS
jgi:hypothetical protein